MSRRLGRNHSAAFRANLAIKDNRTVVELSERFVVNANKTTTKFARSSAGIARM